ncbi:heat shock protein [Longilinea arvoryzae]|uniref:Heat shock protein n=1 Tax=Longilinea arvoryzae TaxID=360412 RepID=A0A0S7BFT9_9CHLR|nr:META domain-containing protein [Longilinea arvoryzae]GAP12625.1 heat shock protein [Longilinea arvoryzae]
MKFTLLSLGMLFCLLLTACAPSDSLNDTTWILSSLQGQPALLDKTVTLNFEDGTLSGTDGCNSYSTAYQISGEKLTIDKNIISTMMACADPIMQQASAFSAALIKTAAYQIKDQELSLLDENGQVLAIFTK